MRWKRRAVLMQDLSTRAQLKKLCAVLVLVVLTHAFAMVRFEALSWPDALWLTMTSATTVGYGDLVARTTEGRVATMVLLYIGGIALLAQVAALYFEYRHTLRQRMLQGEWSWTMKRHIVFMNCPREVDEAYFYRAISGLRKSSSPLAGLPIVIVCDSLKDGLSDRLRALDVVHVAKPVLDEDTLRSASVLDAHTVVILSKDELAPVSDSINFELVDRLREMGVKGRIIVEALKDTNRARLKKVGASNVLRPIRAYPELLMRAIIAPGSEQVIETLFNSEGEECIRYDVDITSRWLDIILKLTAHDWGIPIAYENPEGDIVNNPSSDESVAARAVFVIVRAGCVQKKEAVEALLCG